MHFDRSAPTLFLIWLFICCIIQRSTETVSDAQNLLQRHINADLKRQLDVIIQSKYDGSSKEKILKDIYIYLQSRLTPEQWNEITTEIRIYQQFGIDCSQYSRFLSPFQYQILLALINEAISTGADKYQIKRILNKFLEDAFEEQYKVGKKQSDALVTSDVQHTVKPLFPRVRPWFARGI
uniref:Uncharacterized protein n=1 Tax=Syphacia muris TaxID=451379 RepID=A0A0N5AX25_9BILA